tara:strand:- start:2643 stop:3299 length:657 start_codon:yes stop_codon:yes gene_type:complete
MDKYEIFDRLNFKKLNETVIDDIPAQPGIYFFKLSKNSKFESFENDRNDRILYIGKHEKSIRTRLFENHLNDGSKMSKYNFSTFRRSVGAILKNKLDLNSSPRISRETGKINSYSIYSFSKLKKIGEKDKFYLYDFENFDCETKLNEWITSNLEFSFLTKDELSIQNDLKDIEFKIRNLFKPCLNCNFDDDYNIYRDEIKRMRKVCNNEARLNYIDKV